VNQALKTVKSDGLVTIVGFIAGVAEQQPSAAHKSNKSNPWSNLIYLILLDTGFVV
jgi:hypothetical protein